MVSDKTIFADTAYKQSMDTRQFLAAHHNALSIKGHDYTARTNHLDQQGQPLYTNRLILENSPYLLQHAHNPVEWYPWGNEAFQQAGQTNKPIFLSIGYAACHWCHVMEEQSFESQVVAEFLNQHFISIKVDREQHPDVDATYMTALTLFAGHGGWPMSSFLTPDGKPFFSGTYYPQAGFLDLLCKINHAWLHQHEVLLKQAEQLADAVERSHLSRNQTTDLKPEMIRQAIDQAMSHYDDQYGGFSDAPKFPHEPLMLLMLQTLLRQTDQTLNSAVKHTLSAMARGGIYDQIGGGFHRYAVDRQWRVPHFEKMLYNQAYLARVYLQAYRLYGHPEFKRIAIQTLEYVTTEMRSDENLFWSATDADSEGTEGMFFLWDLSEIQEIVSPDDAAFLIDIYGITDQGNFEGRNILFLPSSLESVAERNDLALSEVWTRLDRLRQTLLEHRNKRIPPLTDRKVLTAWNGMMICAFAEAGITLGMDCYISVARNAVDALWQFQRQQADTLWRVRLNQQCSIEARQEDYVHLTEALIAVYDASGNASYLTRAEQLGCEMLEKFLYPDSGIMAMGNEQLLFTSPTDRFDGAQPSGNAVAVRILNRLYRRSGKPEYRDQADKILAAHSGSMANQPLGHAYMLAQWDEQRNGETDPVQYAGRGHIRIEIVNRTNPRPCELMTIRLQLTNGYYLNTAPDIRYPDNHQSVQVKIDEQPEATFISFPITNEETQSLLLTLQPCNQQECLETETIRVFFR